MTSIPGPIRTEAQLEISRTPVVGVIVRISDESAFAAIPGRCFSDEHGLAKVVGEASIEVPFVVFRLERGGGR